MNIKLKLNYFIKEKKLLCMCHLNKMLFFWLFIFLNFFNILNCQTPLKEWKTLELVKDDYGIFLLRKDRKEQEPADDNLGQRLLTTWQNEKIIFLEPEIKGLPMNKYMHYDSNKIYDQYSGKTGVIVSAGLKLHQAEITIKIEGTNEKVIVSGTSVIGFHSEMQKAKSLIGKSFWTKTGEYITDKYPLKGEAAREYKSMNEQGFYTRKLPEATKIPALIKITVSRVAWGKAVPFHQQGNEQCGSQAVVLYFKTEELPGKEFALRDKRYMVKEEFHYALWDVHTQSDTLMDIFYEEDTLAIFPKLKPELRNLVKKEKIAVGMDIHLAILAAGGALYFKYYDLSTGAMEEKYLTGGNYPRSYVWICDGKVTHVD